MFGQHFQQAELPGLERQGLARPVNAALQAADFEVADGEVGFRDSRRRAPPAVPETDFTIGDLEIRRLERRVYRAGKPLALKPREFRLLEVLAEHAGRVVTRTMLLEQVWDFSFDPGTNVIDAQISRLRAKIDRDFDAPLLHTVRGVGYRLAAD